MKFNRLICLTVIIVMCTILIVACRDQRKTEKPVIYLYPEEPMDISVSLDYEGELTCTYPFYKDGWNVKAYPNGKLINTTDKKEYSYLYWEGKSEHEWELNKGFVIEGDKTAEFLQEKLSYMGLEPREYNEFIVYWLPRMECNKYNLIYFAEEEYEEQVKLIVEPKPNSIQRIHMIFKPLEKYVEIEEQKLDLFERNGFTVIEWGGTELN